MERDSNKLILIVNFEAERFSSNIEKRKNRNSPIPLLTKNQQLFLLYLRFKKNNQFL